MDLMIATELRRYWQEMGLRRSQIARIMGVSQQQVIKYEAGEDRISAGRFLLLARRLGLPLDEFAARVGEKFADEGVGALAPRASKAGLAPPIGP